MAEIRTQDVAYAIYKATYDKKGAELDMALENSVKFIIKNKLLKKKEEILNKLQNIRDKDEGRIKVNLQSKHKLKKESLDHILQFIKHHYKVDEVDIEEEIKEDIIGGVKIQIGNDIIDITLNNQIKQLKNYLLQN